MKVGLTVLGFHKSAVEFLVHERDILGVGVETVGIDPGQADKFDPPFPNHATILGAGKFGLASLSNLDKLPPVGAVIFAAPLKIVQGSGRSCTGLCTGFSTVKVSFSSYNQVLGTFSVVVKFYALPSHRVTSLGLNRIRLPSWRSR